MRKFAAAVAAVVGIAGMAVAADMAEARPRHRPKVTICHATGSPRHPWRVVRVPEGNRGHARHDRDFVLTGGTCRDPEAPEVPEEPEETTTTSSTTTTTQQDG